MFNLSRKAVTWMVLSVVLFIVLRPGVLLTIPSMNGTLAGIWTPSVPSTTVVIHAFVCAVLINLAGGVLKKMGVLVEKFQNPEDLLIRRRMGAFLEFLRRAIPNGGNQMTREMYLFLDALEKKNKIFEDRISLLELKKGK